MNQKDISLALGRALANTPTVPDSIASSFAHFCPEIKNKGSFVSNVLRAKREHLKLLDTL